MELEQSFQSKQPFALNEEQKRFYLEEARMMCPTATDELPECARLSILHGRIKRIVRLLVILHEDTRNEDICDIQKACGHFLMENGVSKKERLSLNRTLSRHINACSLLGKERDIAGYTLDYFTHQLHDLERHLYQKQE